MATMGLRPGGGPPPGLGNKPNRRLRLLRFSVLGKAYFYLFLTIGLGAFGWYLQHKAFTPPPPVGQMYAAVFVRDPAAHVSLSAEVYPDKPSADSLTVSVTGASPKLAGWLLIIECPAGSPAQSRAVSLSSETVPQTQTVVTQVTAYWGLTSPGPKSPFMFNCFASSGGMPGIPGYSPSLANVSLPALQFDQGIVGAQAAPVLYAQQGTPGGQVGQLTQLFPSAVCPSPVPSPTLTPASPSATGTASPSATGTASPSATGTASPSATGTASPSAASPGASAKPSCYAQVPLGKQFFQYSLPATVTTTETLNHVDTAGYQISEFPVGNTVDETAGQTTEESIQWSGQSGLSPSLDAVNQAAEAAANHDIFMAGVFFGLASGTAVGCADSVWGVVSERKRHSRGKHHADDPGGGDQAGGDVTQDPAAQG